MRQCHTVTRLSHCDLHVRPDRWQVGAMGRQDRSDIMHGHAVKWRNSDGVRWIGTPGQIRWAQDIRGRLLPRIARLCQIRRDWTRYRAWRDESRALSWIDLQRCLEPGHVPSPGVIRELRAG